MKSNVFRIILLMLLTMALSLSRGYDAERCDTRSVSEGSDTSVLLLANSHEPERPSASGQNASIIKIDTAIIVSPGLNTENGKLSYTDENGRTADALGLDVSFYNNNIDWTAVKESGIDFVIIRLGGRGWGSGLRYHDTKTQQYLRGARDAGLQIGAYYYSTARNQKEAREEASDALAILDGFRLDLPVYIDMEYSGEYPEGRADLISPVQRSEIADAFISQIENAGYQGGVYSAQSIYKYDFDFPAVSCFPIWLASYTNNNQLPDFSGKYDIWQFTDTGKIGGIDGPVDLNVSYTN